MASEAPAPSIDAVEQHGLIPLKKPNDPKTLLSYEVFWRDHQPWLEEEGYMLRPRYKPGWVPSWTDDKDFYKCEDGLAILTGHLLDATRMSDGKLVMLKRISRSTHPYEIEITRLLSSEPHASHPRNRSVPLYDVLDLPGDNDLALLVLPLLRTYDDPRMESVGEAVEFFRQVFEGLQFMHQLHIAHRDCMNLNIMMDPKATFPNMYHPQLDLENQKLTGSAKYYTRTARPTKYYLIDFGLSRTYSERDLPPREYPILGGDKTVPEFQNSDEPCNPFPTDIYYLGNMVREDFLEKKRGVEFIKPLVDDMVHTDPDKRPTIDQVVERYGHIYRKLPWWKLRSRLIENEESHPHIRGLRHFLRTLGHILLFRPAIPTPRK